MYLYLYNITASITNWEVLLSLYIDVEDVFFLPNECSVQ
jgi:hypothetical protein